MSFLDIDGKHHEELFDDLWATCAQHELDHLNGVLFIDHLSRMKRSMMTKKMVKFKKEFGTYLMAVKKFIRYPDKRYQ